MKKTQIINAVCEKGTFNNKLTDWAENMFFNYIGGEYFYYPYNEKKYNEQFAICKDLLHIAKSNPKKAYKLAVQYVILNFCKALQEEFDCSYSYAQKVMVKTFGYNQLEVINNDLISKMFDANCEFNCCDIALNEKQIMSVQNAKEDCKSCDETDKADSMQYVESEDSYYCYECFGQDFAFCGDCNDVLRFDDGDYIDSENGIICTSCE